MRALALLLFVAACSNDSGDESGGGSGDATGTASEGDASADDPSMTGQEPACETVNDCTTCWKCAKITSCKTDYDACASSIECAGSLACVDYECPGDGITQPCLDHCCLNCMEHLTCFLVDAAVTCIEQECAAYCGDAVCG